MAFALLRIAQCLRKPRLVCATDFRALYATPAPRSQEPLPAVRDWLPDPPMPPLDPEPAPKAGESGHPQHAVVSTFDLLSIGIGPSSSHSVGPMRAGKIFVTSLRDMDLLQRVNRIRMALYGSLAATGKGHLSPQSLLLGLEGHDPETIDPGIIGARYEAINSQQRLVLGGSREIHFNISNDMVWHWDQTLPKHPNGLILTVFDENGDMLATRRYFSIGGGFVVTGSDENVFYKEVRRQDAQHTRRQTGKTVSSVTLELPGETAEAAPETAQPPYPFYSGDSLLEMTRKHNLTIAQLVYENERAFASESEVRAKALRLWDVMNECIRQGVTSTEEYLPGSLRVKRRAPNLHKRLLRGLFPGDAMPQAASSTAQDLAAASGASTTELQDGSDLTHRSRYGLPPAVPLRGRRDHPLRPIAPRRTLFAAMDLLSCYATAVNEVNAAGGRVVTAPTNGAAGIMPACLKYIVEFISEDPERDILTFLFTASAIGQLFKRGATISAAQGGCMAEVGVATSMAAAGFTAIMGGSPEACERAAEVAIEHSLGLTCDPIGGLVQVPCIERNALGAVKAVSSAQIALATDEHTVSLDEAIAAMKQTARDMNNSYKETSRAGLAVSVKGKGGRHAKVSVTVPEC